MPFAVARSFQSHYGLILSRSTQESIRLPLLKAFNPTMVWFYQSTTKSTRVSQDTLSIPLWSDFISIIRWTLSGTNYFFQSHYGLILSQLLHTTTPLNYITFNPTMVWFYLDMMARLPDKIDSLSIPLWSDFINGGTGVKGKRGFLSIPLWSDFIEEMT